MRQARLVLLALAAMITLLALPATGSAAPVFGVTMTHDPIDVPGHGTMPIAHGDRLFTYSIAFENTGTSAGAPGDQLKCEPGDWIAEPAPTFSYQWFKNGTALGSVGGANTDTYTVQPTDAGTAVQCIVTGTNSTNGGIASNAAAAPVPIAPAGDEIPGPADPTDYYSSIPTITVPPDAPEALPEGTPVTCSPPSGWRGEPTYDYRWLRNGVAIGGATSSDYVVQAADAGGLLQCQVIGTNASGTAQGISALVLIAGGPTELTYSDLNFPYNVRLPTMIFPVTSVSVTLPPGVRISPSSGLQGQGWSCTQSTLTCTRSDNAAVGEAYPPLTAKVNLDEDAADELIASATISGGRAESPATGSDTLNLAPKRPFGANAFTTKVVDENGDDETRAGAHPYAATTSFNINSYVGAAGALLTVEDPKTIALDLPPGFLGNPQNAATCDSKQVPLGTCPIESQVGVATTEVIGGAPVKAGVYNVKPRPGHPAEFAFIASSVGEVHLFANIRTGGDYGLTIVTPYSTQAQLLSASFTFWGTPADASHDGERCYPGFSGCFGGAASAAEQKPFLTNLTECRNEPPVTTLRMDSWVHPGDFVSYKAESPLMTECDQLAFDPSISVKPETTRADTPSGYDVHLGVPQTNDVDSLATPPLKDARVTLPPGVTLSPGVSEGLEGCSDAELNLHSADPATCPLASKVGEVHIATPVLPVRVGDFVADGVDYQLTGNIYIRKPDPGATRTTLYSIFLDSEDEQTGIVVKLRGNVVPDEHGTLTTTFEGNPPLPFTDFLLKFKGGDRAPLSNPMTCGPATTTSTLSSWGGPSATPSSTFVVDWDGAGGVCPDALPFTPSFSAGVTNPLAGAFSPFTMTIRRDDRQQIMSGIDVDMPSGLLGMIGSVPLCGDDAAAAGTCGDESQIGSTTVSAGAGNHPFSLPGKVFVAGPYKGQPFSLSIVVRAIAGPFDLGTVVVRAPIMVDAANAKLRVPSDALPTILEGVPLRLRMINILLDRPGFMFNATNCSPQQVGANLSSLQGTVASVSSPYQASNCEALPFKPTFKATSDGRLKFKNGAALKVDITQGPGEAAIKSAAVTLPKELPSRLIPTINNACVQAVFEENPANCPEDSYVGTVTAKTPVFPDPLVGPVYVIARAKEVPQIVAVLRGQGIAKGIDLKLYGDIIIDSGGGRSKSTFHLVPDVPITSFSINLPAGPHSILDAPSYDVCHGPLKIGVSIVGQNGKRTDSNETVKVEHCPKIPGPKVIKAWVTKKGIAVKTLVPSQGRLAVSGTGLIPVARKAVKRGIITANVPYTPAMRKAVQKGAKKLRVKVWFQPSNAAKPSTKTVTVKVKQRKARR